MKHLYAKIAILLALSLSACSPIVATRGNLISDSKFEKVQAHTSKRSDVVEVWGPPTVTSSFDSNTWYYIGETTKQRGIFAPEIAKRRMIKVSFDKADNDTVIEVADLDISKAKDIDIVNRKTPTAGKEYTAVQQFIGNIGKYNKPAPK